MREIIVHLDDRTAERLRAVAMVDGVAEGVWIARHVEDALADLWPDALRSLAGAWADAPPPRPSALRARRGDDVRLDASLRLAAQGRTEEGRA
ncbi:MAG: CopG family transcriptional regulator [Acidobacteriota bacterium]